MMILLWTIQEKEFYQQLMACGVVKATKISDVKPLEPEDEYHITQYKWLGKQMVLRGISQSPVYPIWAWYKYKGMRKKPDLRCSGHMESGKKCVCIEFKSNKSNVLLSQFDMWCSICISTGYLPRDLKESGSTEMRSESTIFNSWSQMFNLEFGNDNYWGPKPNRWIQACVSEIHLSQVVKVQEFVAR